MIRLSWGIAGSSAEGSDVYLVGAAASQMAEAFPLKEFSTTSTLDYYQPVNLYGPGASSFFYPWSRFEDALDFEGGNGGVNLSSIENSHQGTDAFIASFEAYHPVGIEETSLPSDGLRTIPLPSGTAWTVYFPHVGNWTLEVYDAVGHLVSSQHSNGADMKLDLARMAKGLYVLRATNGMDAPLSTKVMRP